VTAAGSILMPSFAILATCAYSGDAPSSLRTGEDLGHGRRSSNATTTDSP
jgi:hypothetical protein